MPLINLVSYHPHMEKLHEYCYFTFFYYMDVCVDLWYSHTVNDHTHSQRPEHCHVIFSRQLKVMKLTLETKLYFKQNWV